MIDQARSTGRFSRLFGRARSDGAGVVACASAMPLVVLALAVAGDYAKVSRFRSRVQHAADAASLATAEATARRPGVGDGGDAIAAQIANSVFRDRAPNGAGTPTIALKGGAVAVTATVGYAGVAPSNFGAALGYDGVSVEASSTSLARLADSRRTVAR